MQGLLAQDCASNKRNVVKKMEIRMARGDLETRTFQIRSPDGQGGTEPYEGTFDEIYMTVKKSDLLQDYAFQKRLGNGTILPLGDSTYQFTIEPEDTDGLGFGEYGFDIELVKAGQIKKTFCGKLYLTKEYTHAANEVVV